MDLETLPDEILLDICRYLSSTEVLYSFYNLNHRLNRTISIYFQHVILRQTSLIQFNSICSTILPNIGSKIVSLSVNANWTDLLAKQFYFYFGFQMKKIFPNLEHLILVAFSGNELNDYLQSISDLPSLTKLTVIDRYNVTEEFKHILFEKILSANQFRLKRIKFNRHSESLTINPINSTIYFNLIQLNIHLEKISDLCILFKLIPNIQQISVVINRRIDDEQMTFDINPLRSLQEFHLESSGRSWILEELHSLLQQMPFLLTLSLDIFSRDLHLLDGQSLQSIYPINDLQVFNYVVKCTPKTTVPSMDELITSWKSTKYSICCLIDDNQSHLFLHTNPYRYSYLEISSLFFKHIQQSSEDYRGFIKELLVFHLTKFEESFRLLNNCNRIKDLAIEIDEGSTGEKHFFLSIISPILYFNLEEILLQKSKIKLSTLPYLRWISIDGYPRDLHLMKEILQSSPYLSMLIINMKYFLQLFDLKDEQCCLSLLKSRIKHLSIQMNDPTDLQPEHIERLSQVFSNIRHLIIEHKVTDVHIEDCLLLFVRLFVKEELISMIIRGMTTEELRENPSEWLRNRTTTIRNPFQIECDQIELKIWF